MLLLLLLLLGHNKQQHLYTRKQQLSTKKHKQSYAFTSTQLCDFLKRATKANSSTVHRKLMRKFNGCKDLHICWHFASLFQCIYAWFTSKLDQLASFKRSFIIYRRAKNFIHLSHRFWVRFMLSILFHTFALQSIPGFFSLSFQLSYFICCSLNWTVGMPMCDLNMFQNSVNPNSSLAYWGRHPTSQASVFFSSLNILYYCLVAVFRSSFLLDVCIICGIAISSGPIPKALCALSELVCARNTEMLCLL